MRYIKKIFSLLLFTFAVYDSIAQNIVPNPSFALYSPCPAGLGQLDYCLYWHNPTSATPDYFNICHDTLPGSLHTAGVPTNTFGTQSSFSNSYIGVGTFCTPNIREYARVSIPALLQGAVYRVSLTISLGDLFMYATYAPSVFFFREADTFVSSHYVLPYSPQVTFESAGHITDNVNWITVTDTFVADSAYTGLIIGNFKDDASTTKTVLATGIGQSYYYIDSVSVEKIANSSVVNTQSGISAAIYPNPNDGNFTVQLPQSTQGILSVTDVTGRLLLRTPARGSTPVRMNAEPGMYFVHVQTEQGNVNKTMVVR